MGRDYVSYDLRRVNEERRRRGHLEMTTEQARNISRSSGRAEDAGFDMTGFLIAYMTGFPVGPSGVTGAALVGALLHNSGSDATEMPSREPDPSPSYSDSGGSSGSSDTGSGGGSDGGSFD